MHYLDEHELDQSLDFLASGADPPIKYPFGKRYERIDLSCKLTAAIFLFSAYLIFLGPLSEMSNFFSRSFYYFDFFY